MPRDLTDLMERATSFAPPEPHGAADITRLAAHRQRRRTTLAASGAALAVVVVAGVAVGLTGNHPTEPEPAHRFKLDQSVDVTRAVPVSSLPGYRLEPWTVPSVQHLAGHQLLPTYGDVDAHGRLIVVDAPSGIPQQGPFRARLFDSPGGAPQPLQAPASSGSTSWIPRFYGADQLLWSGSQPGFHITDLQGGHDRFVRSTFQVGSDRLVASADDVTAGSMWMKVFDHALPKSQASVFNVYRATFSGDVRKVAGGVVALDVGSGTAGWVTTGGQVFTQAATGSTPRPVPVPLDQGCRVAPTSLLQGTNTFAVSSSAIALPEACGAKAVLRLLAFDLSGRRLVRVDGGPAFNVDFAGETVVFHAAGSTFRYDLVTGSLARLTPPRTSRILQEPRGTGSYVLWYDGAGGHVAKIAG